MSITQPRTSGVVIVLVLMVTADPPAFLCSAQSMRGKSVRVAAVQSVLTYSPRSHIQKQSGDPSPKEKGKRTPLPVHIAQLLGKTVGIPAEYRSDALLLIVQAPTIKDADTKVSLIEEAFQLASGSHVPLKKALLPGFHVDTRDGYLAYAYDLKLDALSLQCRAVRAMIPLNPLKARDMFRTIGIAQVPEQKCEYALVPDVSDFYSTLREVAQRTFTSKQVADGEQFQFLLLYVESPTSPLQVGPIAKMLRDIRPSAALLDALVHAFSTALDKVSLDDRAFSYAMESPYGRAVGDLVAECKAQGVIPDHLLRAYREYLIRHLRGRRCRDNVMQGNKPRRLSNYVSWFNTSLRVMGTEELQPISDDTIRPSELSGPAEYQDYWQTPQAKQLLEEARQLQFGSPDRQRTERVGANVRAEPLSAAERSSGAWQAMLRQLLNSLDSWKPEHENSIADYLHQKSVIFDELIDLTPEGPMREKVLSDYLAFLRASQLQMDSGIEWFFHVKRLISGHGSDREFLELLRSLGNPITDLYIELKTRGLMTNGAR